MELQIPETHKRPMVFGIFFDFWPLDSCFLRKIDIIPPFFKHLAGWNIAD